MKWKNIWQTLQQAVVPTSWASWSLPDTADIVNDVHGLRDDSHIFPTKLNGTSAANLFSAFNKNEKERKNKSRSYTQAPLKYYNFVSVVNSASSASQSYEMYNL
jgi:hypothetical protein